MKKLFSIFLMLCCLGHFMFAGEPQEVFDIYFDNEDENDRIAFCLFAAESEDDGQCGAFFADLKKAEVNIIACDVSEYKMLKAIAHDSKVLALSVKTRKDYESKKLYQQIIKKISAFAPVKKEEFETEEEFGGFVKTNYYITKTFCDKYPEDVAILDEKSGTEKSSNASSKKSSKGSSKKDLSDKIVIWSFTDEIQQIVDNYYKSAYPKTEVEYSLTPTDQFPNKLDVALANGTAPDVFALESAFFRRYVELGEDQLLDLTDVYNEIKGKSLAYPVQAGTYKGRVYALSWQAYPGAMFYRRSLAKKYLGTDDPAEVQKYVADWNKFLSTAQHLKNKSDGRCVIVAATGDLYKPMQGARKSPWIENERLVIDPAMTEYMKLCKTLREKDLEAHVYQWSEGWFAGMKGELRDERGDPVEVFSYFMPSWGLHYVLKPNAPNTDGDWAMIPGPSPYYWGGTWIAAYKNTKNPKLVKEFIKFIASDESFQEQWAKNGYDLVTNKDVVKKVKGNFCDPFLAGQNYYEIFADIADKVDGSLTQDTDAAIDMLFNEYAVAPYEFGEKSFDEALEDFRTQVSTTLGY